MSTTTTTTPPPTKQQQQQQSPPPTPSRPARLIPRWDPPHCRRLPDIEHPDPLPMDNKRVLRFYEIDENRKIVHEDIRE